ncbi:hypothetical protein NL676_023553 [Syzygium grande]|nr:hypothetical protein NL676_023553 [Syzygium grande]
MHEEPTQTQCLCGIANGGVRPTWPSTGSSDTGITTSTAPTACRITPPIWVRAAPSRTSPAAAGGFPIREGLVVLNRRCHGRPCSGSSCDGVGLLLPLQGRRRSIQVLEVKRVLAFCDLVMASLYQATSLWLRRSHWVFPFFVDSITVVKLNA